MLQFFQKHRIRIITLLISVLILIVQHVHLLSGGNLHIVFLNIGQGDGILITTPDNRRILIDSGPTTKVLQELPKHMPFLDRRIEYLILTHPDNDHVFGTVEVAARYDIQNLLITGINHTNPAYHELLTIARRKNINIKIAASEADLQLGDLVFDIIYPFKNLTGTNSDAPNNTSIVARLIYGKNSMLLTGDIEKEIEEEILAASSHTNPGNSDQKLSLQSDILKVPHHGSKSSSTQAFLDAINPRYAIIQSASGNDFGHPHLEVLKRLIQKDIKILRNDFHGAIEIVMNKEGILQIKKTN